MPSKRTEDLAWVIFGTLVVMSIFVLVECL
jgi:hypothetical protein